jgi:hypothetical protein
MIERFLMHPLFIEFDPQTPEEWKCHTDIPQKTQYTVIKAPSQRVTEFDPDILEDALTTWLCRRSMNILCSRIGILHREKKRILTVDMVAEDSNKDVIFIVTVTSTQRLLNKRRQMMNAYGKLVKDQTQKIYGFNPTLYIMNIYGDCRIHTSMI